MRSILRVTVLGLVALLCAAPAQALIKSLMPLRTVLAEHQYILVARVESIAPDKPGVVFTADEDLKDKLPVRRLPVNLTGDSEAKKDGHTAQLLKRLAPKLPVVLFVNQRDRRYTAFAYTNGTWFQMVGQKTDDGGVRWFFTHAEPYLRRTFKGTTDELKQAIVDGLAGKRTPPEPDEKVEPGFGPEVEKKPDGAALPRSDRPLVVRLHHPADGHPALAVIPTVLVGGPLAILAMLFPAVFGGLLIFFRRWVAVLTVASLNSTLYLVHAWFAGSLRGSWWGGMTALWAVMTLVTALGALWAWRRQRAALQAGESATPSGLETGVLVGLALLGVATVLYQLLTQQSLLTVGAKSLLVLWIGAWAGTLYVLYLRWAARHRRIADCRLQIADCPESAPTVIPSTEGIMLGAMTFACFALMAAREPAAVVGGVRVAWEFFPKEGGVIASTPLVVGDAIYVAAAHQQGLERFGRLYCLDRETGQVRWTFSNEDDVINPFKRVFSTPCLHDGRLYIGEGFHEDKGCRLFCLDAATGKKVWDFETSSHTESGPCVADGRVYFGAGDDGVYCLDAKTGEKRWQHRGVHVDANPTVVGGRLYVGSGVGDVYKETAVLCLDATTGQQVWWKPVPLPAWGSPVVDGNEVYFGIGNGNFRVSDANPRGRLLGLDARTGEPLWPAPELPDGVMTQPALSRELVFFGCRDGGAYAVNRKDGQIRWRHAVGKTVVASPALADSGRVYFASTDGRVACLDTATGEPVWAFDVSQQAQSAAELLASPVLLPGADGRGRRVLVGAGLTNVTFTSPALYCLTEDEAP